MVKLVSAALVGSVVVLLLAIAFDRYVPRNRAGNVISSENVMAKVLSNGAKLKGQYAIVTGATSGVGLVSAIELAKNGVFVTIAARSTAKAAEVLAKYAKEITANIDVIECDLESFASTRNFALAYLRTERPLNILMLNAGVAKLSFELTVDGWESTFQTCHLSHFLLFCLLQPKMLKSIPARVVLVSSGAHRRPSDWDWPAPEHKGFGSDNGEGFATFPNYGRAKLANIYMAQGISQRHSAQGLTAFACHPGVVDTDIWPSFVIGRSLFMLNESQGASTQLYLATARELAFMDFLYMEPGTDYPKTVILTPSAQDPNVSQRLWDESTRIVQPYLT